MKMRRAGDLRGSAIPRIIVISVAVLILLFLEVRCFRIPTIVSNKTIKRLNSFSVPKYGSAKAFDDMLQTINAYMFEYKKGSRIPGDEIILIDTKSWKYPKQDSSITVDVPEPSMNETKYYITKFRVFICQDTPDSEGYLAYGGPGNSSMGLKFTSKASRYISYDIRLYGIHSDIVLNSTELFQNVTFDSDD